MKLPPFTVSVKPEPPALAVLGLMVVRLGTGLGGGGAGEIVKFCAADVPPPGAGFTAITVAVPGEMTSLAGMAAVRDVLLT